MCNKIPEPGYITEAKIEENGRIKISSNGLNQKMIIFLNKKDIISVMFYHDKISLLLSNKEFLVFNCDNGEVIEDFDKLI